MKNPNFHPANDVALSPARETILDIVERGENPRRRFFKGSVAGTTVALMGGLTLDSLTNSANAAYTSPSPAATLGFNSVPVNLFTNGAADDKVTVPAGYSVSVLIGWGDPVSNGPQLDPTRASTEAEQLQQYGMNVDGMYFFPFATRGGLSNDRGLLCVNHEYTDEGILAHDAAFDTQAGFVNTKNVTLAQVRTSQAAHGVSVIEVRKVGNAWSVVRPSIYGRRITANTPMEIRGPAAGHDLMKTAADSTGTQCLGTANNCAAGYTPWNTFLTAEENWNGYFGATTGAVDANGLVVNDSTFAPSSLENRYGLNRNGFGYRWHHADARFNMNQNRNEPNRFGWVVEIDPFDPKSKPIKRTALGRIKHENAEFAVGPDNTFAVYSGDDERNDYIYKFVASAKYNPTNRAANKHLLDAGTLYVAKLNANGTGTWMPLTYGQNGLVAPMFNSQAEVLIKTRQAADVLDATEMDRPEWIAVHPTSREVYVTLTNNNRRGTSPSSLNSPTTVAATARPPIDAANPRKDNKYGHIIRWREDGDNPGATTFTWEIFTLAGDSANTSTDTVANYQGNINGDDFGAPDGLWFDHDNRLWIQTDQQGDATGDWANIGANSMLAADPVTREVKRFLTSPKNCEVTGVTSTPDGKTFFVGIQHPGEDWVGSFTSKSTWPDSGINGPTRLNPTGAAMTPTKPRAATLVITHNGGQKIGAGGAV